MSEIILQQTRTAQGLPYYERFINAYPTVEKLAAAPLDEVLKLWQGLGYYSRARNLHATAQQVVDQYDGVFPNHFKALKELKGVGDYTASAIGSICFDLPEAVVDGNVYRLLSRCFGIFTPIDHSNAFKEFKTLANRLMDTQQPGTFNQALMEFGAVLCTPKNPDCGRCPFQRQCVAFNQQKIDQLPFKAKTTKVRKRYFNYLVVSDFNSHYLLQQRTAKDIWEQLFEFPLVETTQTIKSSSALQKTTAYQETFSEWNYPWKRWNPSPILHKLSHQQLYITFWTIQLNTSLEEGMPWEQLTTKAVPVVIQNFIENFFLRTP